MDPESLMSPLYRSHIIQADQVASWGSNRHTTVGLFLDLFPEGPAVDIRIFTELPRDRFGWMLKKLQIKAVDQRVIEADAALRYTPKEQDIFDKAEEVLRRSAYPFAILTLESVNLRDGAPDAHIPADYTLKRIYAYRNISLGMIIDHFNTQLQKL